MSQFDDRKKAAENKFSHDKELEFKATARRNKLLGQWAKRLTHMPFKLSKAISKSQATKTSTAKSPAT